jgi:hypothetical protein
MYIDHKFLLSALQNIDKGRICRWQLRLSEYNFQIIHIEGRENVIADGLSRLPLGVIQLGASEREESCLEILLVDAGIDGIIKCANCKIGKEWELKKEASCKGCFMGYESLRNDYDQIA